MKDGQNFPKPTTTKPKAKRGKRKQRKQRKARSKDRFFEAVKTYQKAKRNLARDTERLETLRQRMVKLSD